MSFPRSGSIGRATCGSSAKTAGSRVKVPFPFTGILGPRVTHPMTGNNTMELMVLSEASQPRSSGESVRRPLTLHPEQTMTKTHKGSCFCGSVDIAVSGKPVVMGYCHCNSCRHWSASPVNAFTLWQPESVKITQGEENIGTYNKTPQSYRKWCKTCGGHIFTEHPGLGLTDVYAAVVADLPFIPGLHVNYGETTLPIRDSLLKLKDFPKGFGGSGIELLE